MTCIKKNRRYLGGRDDTGGMHHHRVLHYNHRPRYFDKVGMCYFHRLRNKFYRPAVDRLWSLGPDGVKDPVMTCDVYSALLTGIAPPYCSKICGQNSFYNSPRY